MEKEIKQVNKKVDDVLAAINDFADKTEEKFNGLEKDVGYLRSNMVTEDHLDDKFHDLKGDLIVLMRKEDIKIRKLIEILKKRKVISEKEFKEILSMEPFPQLFI